MKPNKTRATLVLAFVIALGAGVVGGVLLSRMPFLSTVSGAPPVTGQSPLSEMLQLTPDQSDKMRSIWEEARAKAQTAVNEVQQLQKGRDDAFVSILTTDEQKSQYEKITKDYAVKFDSVTAGRDRVFQDAVEQTRQILNSEQQKKYEEVIRSRLGPKMPGKDSPILLPEHDPVKHH